jgi:maltose O-acetyltransferase
VFFNFNCVVLDVCAVRIGDFTLFGPGVQILTPMHPLNAAMRRRLENGKPVQIGADVWVGGGALMLAGVSIGSKAVIGAGSVVTRTSREAFLPQAILVASSARSRSSVRGHPYTRSRVR